MDETRIPVDMDQEKRTMGVIVLIAGVFAFLICGFVTYVIFRLLGWWAPPAALLALAGL